VNQQHQQLNEGLRPMDLKEMVHSTFEIDTYSSKMGEDSDVCVLSFRVKDRAPAKDMMEFIERGYHYVLDSDISSGENNNGDYFVFVELERSSKLAEQIKDITDGVNKLTGITEWKFKYHKEDKVHEVTEETLSSRIPKSAQEYEGRLTRVKTEGIKSFFTKTLMDDLTLDGDIITIHKPFGQTIQLKMISENDSQSILEGVTDTLTVDERSTSEAFWLTKVLGDYDISKFGDKFLFTNGQRAMFLQRI
jgi:hypothetical protein